MPAKCVNSSHVTLLPLQGDNCCYIFTQGVISLRFILPWATSRLPFQGAPKAPSNSNQSVGNLLLLISSPQGLSLSKTRNNRYMLYRSQLTISCYHHLYSNVDCCLHSSLFLVNHTGRFFIRRAVPLCRCDIMGTALHVRCFRHPPCPPTCG